MQHHAVDGVVGVQGVGWGLNRQAQDAPHLQLGGHHLVEMRRMPGPRRLAGAAGGLPLLEEGQQLMGPVVADAHGLEHRHAQLTRQHLAVDVDALAACGIAHVQGQHHGQAQGSGLQHQAQVELQVGGIGHAHQQIGHRLAGTVAGHDVARDGLIGTQGVQAVGARQVQHHHAPPSRRGHHPLLALDGDARVVGDLLAAAGEQVEQRGLAAIGVAQQGGT